MGELFDARRQLLLAGLFEPLEVWVISDGHFHAVTEQILELPAKRRDHLVPGTDLLDERLDIPLFPEAAFIAHRIEATELSCLVEQGNDAEMAAQEVRHPAALRIAGVLGFHKRPPRPAGQPGFQLPMSGIEDVGGILTKAEVGFLAALARPGDERDHPGRGDPARAVFRFARQMTKGD